MTHRARSLSMLILLLVATGVPARAADPGDVGVFFDAAGTQTARSIPVFALLDVYVIAFAPPGGLSAFQLRFVVPTADPPWAIVERDPVFDCLLAPCYDEQENWIVGSTSACLQDPVVVLLHYAMVPLTPVPPDTPICLTGLVPPASPTPSPMYLTCGPTEDWQPFGAAYQGCALLNPSNGTGPIPDAGLTWGSVKARYGS